MEKSCIAGYRSQPKPYPRGVMPKRPGKAATGALASLKAPRLAHVWLGVGAEATREDGPRAESKPAWGFLFRAMLRPARFPPVARCFIDWPRLRMYRPGLFVIWLGTKGFVT
jgi:hypothetical protein